MKKYWLFALLIIMLIACNNKTVKQTTDNRIYLHPDEINRVKLTDTLVILETVCRGCAYENSTEFLVVDSLGVIKLIDIVTKDNNAANVEGGSIGKTLILVPQKKGSTRLTVTKIPNPHSVPSDSILVQSIAIEVN